ncbi:MAG: fibrobacter succinogenes major paralogous domain-containing protein [Sphingobacteriales bacterium]|nr:fibrobacter succinogenes major paralogous domain-containing protein [Sphingobacteriales bacterium]
MQVINNAALANATNQLQGIYNSGDGSNINYSYYGDFDASGNPKVLKYATMSKTGNDTTMNYTFDDTLRVKTAYVSVDGVKDSILLVYDYASDKVITHFYFVDWTTGTYILRHDLVTNKVGDTYTFGSFHRLSSGHTPNSNQKITGPIDITAQWIVQVGAGQAAIAVCNGIIGIATLAAAVLIASTSPVLATAAILFGLSAVFSSNGHADTITLPTATTISTPPANTPPPPTQQTINTINTIVPPPPGPTGTVTDIDGNVYNMVTIGTQVWMKENLKTTRYNDGSAIPTGLSNTAWQNTTSGAYAIYDNNAANNTTYGKLYNWYAVNTGKLAPAGWHVPTDAEWTTLTTFLGGELIAGDKMKATTLWTAYTGITNTNSSGFTGLPAGNRYYNGSFDVIGLSGYFWSSTEGNTSFAWYRYLGYGDSGALRGNYYKGYGFSVRCVRD